MSERAEKNAVFGLVVFALAAVAATWVYVRVHGLQRGASAFVGETGYMVQYPTDYAAASGSSDSDKKNEVVYFFPQGTSIAALKGEAEYGRLGVIRLEVQPRSDLTLADVRGAMTESAKKRKETFTQEDRKFSFPAFEMRISAPLKLVQVVVLGSRSVYLFTAGADGPVLDSLLQSLTETPPDR